MKAVQLTNGSWVSYCDEEDEPYFPSPHLAHTEPAGLLQVGGSLTPEWLLLAYHQGIFPWFSEGDPILWWSPDPRTILRPQAFVCRRSLAKVVRNAGFRVTSDLAFDAVIRLCSDTRSEEGTWILPEMQSVYRDLHRLGHAHSIEVWQGDQLVGGLYGLQLGKVFFGESMFALVSNASKVALYHLSQQLAEQGYVMIDCQFSTDHLRSLGAIEVSRQVFLDDLSQAVNETTAWRFQPVIPE
jgi:leucyl/phenylalanyl-tRNA--protein transferase